MIKKLIKILDSTPNVNAWKIIDKEIQAEELFFIKKSLDMNRSKTVRHIFLTIYIFKDRYKGSKFKKFHIIKIILILVLKYFHRFC